MLVPPDAAAGSDADPIACSFPIGAIVEERPHVRLGIAPGASVCDGSIDYLERTAVAQAELLGVELGTLCYEVWTPDTWPASPCPEANACTQPDGNIDAPRPDSTHELVHAMRRSSWTVPLFEEGAAVALGDDSHDDVLETYVVSVAEMLTGAEPLSLSNRYQIAGDFSSYLVTSRSPERFGALLAALPRALDPTLREEAFRTVYEASLDEVLADRWAGAWRFHGGDLSLPECAAPSVAWDGSRWESTWSVECHGEGAGVGPDADLRPLQIVSYVREFQTIDVPAEGLYRLDVGQSRLGAWLEVGWCPDPGGTAAPYEAFSFGSSSVEDYLAFVHLRAGRYALTSWASWPEPATLSATLEPASAPSCDEPLAIDETSRPLFLAPHPNAPISLTIRPSVDRTLRTQAVHGVKLTICDGCAGVCDEIELDQGTSTPLSANVRYRLTVTAPSWGGYAWLGFRAP